MSTRILVTECFDGNHAECRGHNGPTDNPNFTCDCDCHRTVNHETEVKREDEAREIVKKISDAALELAFVRHDLTSDEVDCDDDADVKERVAATEEFLERLKEDTLNCLTGDDTGCLDPEELDESNCELLWLKSLLATARREEREAALERACLAVCARCRLAEQFTPAERVGNGKRWFHRAANTSFEDGIASQCDAWPIRNLIIEAAASKKGEMNG